MLDNKSAASIASHLLAETSALGSRKVHRTRRLMAFWSQSSPRHDGLRGVPGRLEFPSHGDANRGGGRWGELRCRALLVRGGARGHDDAAQEETAESRERETTDGRVVGAGPLLAPGKAPGDAEQDGTGDDERGTGGLAG